MAAEGGAHDLAVAPDKIRNRLAAEPFSFEFFQAVRLLAGLFPARQEVGRFQPPASEVVRFSAHATVSFPASEIQSLSLPEDGQPLMTVNFMGLTGPLGVLPLYYTELVMERLRARDTGLRDFLDVFNHRSISLFYQAWEKYRFPIAYERGGATTSSEMLQSMVGLGTPALANRQAVGDEALLFYTGLLAPAAAFGDRARTDSRRLLRGPRRGGAVRGSLEQPGSRRRRRDSRTPRASRRNSDSAPSWETRFGTCSRACGSSWGRCR